MKYFICYDIASDHWRDKWARVLAESGCKRVQKSVFLAPDFSVRELTALQRRFEREVRPHLASADSLLCLPVENDQLAALIWHGDNGTLREVLDRPGIKFL